MRHLKTVNYARFIKEQFFEIVLLQVYCIYNSCFQWKTNFFLGKL